MSVDELIEKLKEARARAGYNAEVRFYTDMTRHAPDDELVATPEIEADFQCEPSNVAVKLYATDPEDTSMAEIESAARNKAIDDVARELLDDDVTNCGGYVEIESTRLRELLDSLREVKS